MKSTTMMDSQMPSTNPCERRSFQTCNSSPSDVQSINVSLASDLSLRAKTGEGPQPAPPLTSSVLLEVKQEFARGRGISPITGLPKRKYVWKSIVPGMSIVPAQASGQDSKGKRKYVRKSVAPSPLSTGNVDSPGLVNKDFNAHQSGPFRMAPRQGSPSPKNCSLSSKPVDKPATQKEGQDQDAHVFRPSSSVAAKLSNTPGQGYGHGFCCDHFHHL